MTISNDHVEKNLLFLALCLFGLGSLMRGLLSRERVHFARDFRPMRFTVEPVAFNDWKSVRDGIDQEFRDSWTAKNLKPAKPADVLTIARRLSLGLTGTVPSVEEIRALEQLPEEQRLEWWVSYLLADRRSSDYIAERLARAMIGVEDGPFIVFRRSRFVTWLSSQLQKNVPYDQIVWHVIADEGIWTDTPSTNFLTVSFDQDNTKKLEPVKLATRTARAFLGYRLDCVQCHDDNLNTINFGTAEKPVAGEQHHFHEFAAFYGQAKLYIRGVRDDPKQTYQTQYLRAEKETPVQPRVPFGREYFPSEGRPRQQLAGWITSPQNKAFARATVNRLWAIIFGKPLHDPIDNIPLQGRYEPALETLANDFVEHRFDLHRLIRLIIATEVFRLDSSADFEITDEHERALAVFPMTSLRPEQVAGSLIQAAKIGTIDGDAHVMYRLVKFGQTNDFVKRYGDAGQDEFAEHGSTIPQRLMMMNGQLVKERTQQNIVLNASTRIALLAPENKTAVETAFLATLTRRPTPTELEHFMGRLEKKQPTRMENLEDLYWTLINSTEFAWNH